MSRKKTITDEKLLELIQEFFKEICNGDPKRLKMPAIADYVSQSGYSGYRVETLRRNKAAREYIDSLTNAADGKALTVVVAYKALDVPAFLNANQTYHALTRSLTQLDLYYKTVADSAVLLNQKYKDMEKELEKVTYEYNQTMTRLNEAVLLQRSLTEQNRQLKKENTVYKRVVEDYVYPNIANELLKKEGLLKGTGSFVIKENLDHNIISSSTTIIPKKPETPVKKVRSDSTVIQGLFDSLK